jgi:molecular chaperone GrpE (heat shock protein)
MNRDEIVSRFEEWLDRALQAEEPPAGIDAEILRSLDRLHEAADNEPDDASSYALWAATTALTQEVKLQGRAFKELDATVSSISTRLGDEIRAGNRERERELQREAERRCRKEILGALLDVRDRLERGLVSASATAAAMTEAPRRSWLARIILRTQSTKVEPGAAILAALIKGYELSLDRLDQTLNDFNARQILSQGQPFDPRRMNAIDKQESAGVPAGTVLEVYRAGYEWNGEVFRTAQVKVSVPPEEHATYE